MRNIGPKSKEALRRIGVFTHGDLIAVGSVKSMILLKRIGVKPTLNMLWAMEGAIRDCDWRAIAPEVKRRLTDEIKSLEVSEAGRPGPGDRPERRNDESEENDSDRSV